MSNQPLVCPKCGRVYSPTTPECFMCNAKITAASKHCNRCFGYHSPDTACPPHTTGEVK